MRSFVVSAFIIAGVLTGQQWVAKASEAQSRFDAAAVTQIVNARPEVTTWKASGV